MTATPGQRAYEASVAWGRANGRVSDRPGWNELQPWQHEQYEAMAATAAASVTAERDRLREGIAALAATLTSSASATRPSRKSDIEDEIAIALRKLLEP